MIDFQKIEKKKKFSYSSSLSSLSMHLALNCKLISFINLFDSIVIRDVQ